MLMVAIGCEGQFADNSEESAGVAD